MKIYGTIGPACYKVETLTKLFEKGMTGIRLNLSHASLKESSEWIYNIKEAYKHQNSRIQVTRNSDGLAEHIESEQSLGKPEILIDLQGPELRLGKLSAEREVTEGDMLTLLPTGKPNLFDPTEISVPENVLKALNRGQEILIDDGKILLQVEELLSGGGAECQVVRGGVLKSGKSIALSGKEVDAPTLTEGDLKNIASAKEYGVTGVMLPFVRGKEDLINLKNALIEANAEEIQIFAKIENMTGVEKIEGLLPYCDEIVIARGDLGNAMPLWELPVVQAKLAKICKQAGKPFMVVTQMLASMEHAALPTRAEVSDIFRAVEEGAASVMVTGETAVGAYPIEAMTYLVNTVRAAEKYFEK